MKFRKLLLGGIVLSSTVNAQTITLEQVFQHVIDKHPAFVVENYQPEIRKKQQEQASGGRDWSIYTNAGYGHTVYEDSYFYDERYKNKNFNLGLNKTIWPMGARVSLSYGTSRSDHEYYNSNYELIGDDYYNSNLSASVYFDLWRNIGGIQYRSFYERLGYDVTISRFRQDENKEAFLLRVGQSYINWLTTSELQNLTAQYIEAAEDLLKYVKSIEGDASSSRKQMHTSRYSLSMNRQNAGYMASFKEQQKRLAEYFQRQELLGESPVSTKKQGELPEHISADQLSATRLMQIFTIRETQLEHDRRVALNSTNPNLSFALGGYLSGNGEHFKDSHNSERHSYNVGLGFSTSLENTSARAELDTVDLRRIELRNLKQDAELRLGSDLQSVLKLLKELQKVLEYSKQSVELAARTVQLDLDSFKAGAIDIAVLIRSLETELLEKTAYVEAQSRYQRAYLNYLALTDELWRGNNSGSVGSTIK